MNNIYLMLFLCLSLQGCSAMLDNPEAPTVLVDPAAEEKETGGAASITEFFTIMSKLKKIAM